ncbi:MAG: tetrahydrodipicolinate N-succinyltransferase N-terminal domain-containing protein, partial [Minisyncoccia bacterium]
MSQSSQQYPQNLDDFNRVTSELRASADFREPLVFAIGRRVFTRDGTLASVRYPVVNGPGKNLGTAAILIKVLGIIPEGVQNVSLTRDQLTEAQKYFALFDGDGKRHDNIEAIKRAHSSSILRRMETGDPLSSLVATFVFDDISPVGVEDSTLKLYCLSNRHFRPNTLNLTKIFTKLPNVAWHGDVPMDESSVDWAILDAAFENDALYAPHMVDKFPLYIHRINALKMGVRITDQHKVRLGAYLGEGTTLMPGASYINFNAGTEGPSMVEGRISSSAFVGAGSDIGGG